MGIKKKKRVSRVVLYTFNIILSLLFLAPVIWMVVSSLKPEVSIFADMSSMKAFWPTEASFDNYKNILQKGEIIKSILNSVYYVAVTIVFGLIINSMCGYALAKLQFRGKDFLFSLVVALIIIPLESIILPLYQLGDDSHLYRW